MNIIYYITDATGMVTQTGTTDDIGTVYLEIGESVHQGVARIGQVLSGGVLQSEPASYLWECVRQQRGMMMIHAGAELAELTLTDSFPLLTATQKQAKIDALITYRQSLRDITTQSDPANIAWPVAPV